MLSKSGAGTRYSITSTRTCHKIILHISLLRPVENITSYCIIIIVYNINCRGSDLRDPDHPRPVQLSSQKQEVALFCVSVSHLCTQPPNAASEIVLKLREFILTHKHPKDNCYVENKTHSLYCPQMDTLCIIAPPVLVQTFPKNR